MNAAGSYPLTLAEDIVVDRATVGDVDAITDLVNFWAARGDMLPRTKGETYENLRDFFVVRDAGAVVACGALHIVWADIAELKSLAVSEERQGRGYGAQLTRACIEEGARLGLDRLFALTYRPEFFERLGFAQADVMALPRKVWNECYRCPKFPGCNEIAMTLDLAAVRPADTPAAAAQP
ncbi:MAG: N-acetyltransferase [Chloroflexi bacterium]|nr:N-acetyltransferase [Chloroflexota bacterium]